MKTGKMTMDYNPETKAVSVHIELENGTVWLTKSQIAELFGVYISAVTMNLKSIHMEDEAFLDANRSEISYHTASGEYYHRILYNLDIIILLAFKMKGGNCHLFRQWLREQVKRPIVESRQQPMIIQIVGNSLMN
ncbi:Putative DNA-binding protein in cluster with Type I restriction-modification system [Mucinivorans hirudinis]|uniref:Putative DNA-binding protein in cluster with Type I restriction-modification system n=1 Tax=Mucinivorans hirudinis TaxID=1433126 RepID=A0A060R9K7_9BACT|nr:Putative DNA-binding protein in cluster with Type I restriction-modification system [Mucinivorans hirudinis]